MKYVIYFAVLVFALVWSAISFAGNGNGEPPVCPGNSCGTKVGNKVNTTVHTQVNTNVDNRVNARSSSKSTSGANVNVAAPRADRFPGTPAPVFVDACSSGVSASTPGYGASFGNGSPVCLWLALSNAASTQGNDALAAEYIKEAETALRHRRFVTRFLDWLPLIGPLF